jgi:uncharacterized protein (DUF305 family)
MNRSKGALLLAVTVFPLTACASGPTPPPRSAIPPIPHVQADVDFMQGMIPHHAQAVLMAGWAASHGASPEVALLSRRIVVSQTDEIGLMQRWLAERGEAVPPADATHHTMVMDGMEHEMLMPGMLTDEQLVELDAARGPEFDRLFLTYMIMHHEGAIGMVDTLFGSYGAAQDGFMFKFASDVFADQTAEIDRMRLMLAGG